jgi:uncharacterized circularly permuted ATP-grasp superfamily protein
MASEHSGGGADTPELPDGYDEHRDEAGRPRPGYAELLAALEGVDLATLAANVAAQLEQHEVSFGGTPFTIDPIPRLILGAEWDTLSAGLAQRTRALNQFLLDAYSEQRVVDAGIVSSETIREAEGFEPDLVRRLPDQTAPAAIIGFDVVRDPSGEYLVLEDNVRTPSGYAYALAARVALLECLPPGYPQPRPVDQRTYELLAGVMRSAAPPGCEEPSTVVLTDGPGNVAYFEHAQAAARLGATLATTEELLADGEELLVRLPDGEVRAVDVVYRRTNEDRARDEHGELTPVGRTLLPAWLSGRIGLVNAFGNGLADDKLVHSHVEDFIRFYLDEEPLVRSVTTDPLETEEQSRQAAARLRELVVKPRHGHGGEGVVIGAHAEQEDLDRLAETLQEQPGRFISQPVVVLSQHPTVVDGRLALRHVDLRSFAFFGEQVELMPGGLSRVALDAGALVVNSSQNGGGKDTWVVD